MKLLICWRMVRLFLRGIWWNFVVVLDVGLARVLFCVMIEVYCSMIWNCWNWLLALLGFSFREELEALFLFLLSIYILCHHYMPILLLTMPHLPLYIHCHSRNKWFMRNIRIPRFNIFYPLLRMFEFFIVFKSIILKKIDGPLIECCSIGLKVHIHFLFKFIELIVCLMYFSQFFGEWLLLFGKSVLHFK